MGLGDSKSTISATLGGRLYDAAFGTHDPKSSTDTFSRTNTTSLNRVPPGTSPRWGGEARFQARGLAIDDNAPWARRGPQGIEFLECDLAGDDHAPWTGA